MLAQDAMEWKKSAEGDMIEVLDGGAVAAANAATACAQKVWHLPLNKT